jgi:hypothetical protein
MASKLSNLTFTNEDNIVPPSAVEQILNTEIANTLAADDIIIGTANDYGFENVSVLTTDGGNSTITGIENLEPEFGSNYGIVNSDTLNADEDNDILTGTSRDDSIVNFGTLNAGEGNDTITGTTSRGSGYRDTSLYIHSIKCIHANADSFGPDDTYIKFNGRQIWGDYNMNDGQARSVDFYTFEQSNTQPWIELFDEDRGWSRDDSMGGFIPVSTGNVSRTQQVHGSGSTYEVRYSYYDSNSPFLGYAQSGGTRSGGTRSGGTRSGGTRNTSGGTRDYSIGQDYTSGGTRDYSIGQDYTSGGTWGENVRMPIQF